MAWFKRWLGNNDKNPELSAIPETIALPPPEPEPVPEPEPEQRGPFEPPQLGDRVRDPITGFTGIVVVIATWLHGCIRVGVQPENLEEGKVRIDQHFDQSQLIVVKKRVHAPMILSVVEAPPPEERRSNGGPARESAGFRRA